MVDDHNKVMIGNSGVPSIGGHVKWTTFSDGRFKKEITEDEKGLEFIKLLKPVGYCVDIAGIEAFYDTTASYDTAGAGIKTVEKRKLAACSNT